MDASKIFESVLYSVENSKLNFMMTRTPFSASISLKKSLSKTQDTQPDEQCKSRCDYLTELEGKVEILEEKLKNAEIKRSRFEELYNQEKSKVKQATEMEGQFRAELLNIKSEKNTLNSSLKTLQVKEESIEKEINHIQIENKELVSQLKSKSQSLSTCQSKVTELMNEKEGSEIMIENLMAKVKDFKDQINLRGGDNCCTFCEHIFENHFDMKVHVKDKHFISQGTQCDVPETDQQLASKESLVTEFVVYNCFYCNRPIQSEDHLKIHKKECHTVCAICDAKCRGESDLQLHMSQYHAWTSPQFLCNMCPTNFTRNESLQAHRNYSHKNPRM